MTLIKYIERVDSSHINTCLVDDEHPETVLTGGMKLSPTESAKLYAEWGRKHRGCGSEEEKAYQDSLAGLE